MLNAPVVFIIFNRPRQTALTFEAIRQQRPSQLFIVADGPRPDHPTDQQRCRAVRKIVESINWPCEVQRDYSDVNLGCNRRVVSGLDWVFSQVGQAIILEDDCLPDPSFFAYCEQLLDRYAEDERVIHIAGTNIVPPNSDLADSYIFSRLVPIWGWATWRRGWERYDDTMRAWPAFRCTGGLDYFGPQRDNVFKVFEHHETGAWDGRWAFACVNSGKLSIVPRSNLIANVGFDEDATHTKSMNEMLVRPSTSLSFPLRHPVSMEPDRRFDIKYLQQLNGVGTPLPMIRRICNKVRRLTGL